MKCVGDQVKFTIRQSFVPESRKSKYFLIARNDRFIASFRNTCSSAFSNDTGLEFDSLLGMRQSLNAIATSCPEVFPLNLFESICIWPHTSVNTVSCISAFVLISKL